MGPSVPLFVIIILSMVIFIALIQIVPHLMDRAYGRGYIKAMRDGGYFRERKDTHPLESPSGILVDGSHKMKNRENLSWCIKCGAEAHVNAEDLNGVCQMQEWPGHFELHRDPNTQDTVRVMQYENYHF